MIRVVAGEWRGRKLRVPDRSVRPTQDRVRQVLFDILGPRVVDGRVLDLYAGSGALGIEALSRGALESVFVEESARVVKTLRQNIEALDATGRSRVYQIPAIRALTRFRVAGDRFRWIFADPPYDDPEIPVLLGRLGEMAPELIEPEGGVVLETRKRTELPECPGCLVLDRQRRLGDTMLHFYRVGSVPDLDADPDADTEADHDEHPENKQEGS